jgi:hypothetical protein
MKNFIIVVVFVAGIAGLCYVVKENWYRISQMRMPETNIRMPSVGR